MGQPVEHPPGPIYAALKRGETVTLEDGRCIDGQSCAAPNVQEPALYCTDTVFCESAVKLAEGADLLIHESTFSHAEADMAFRNSTPRAPWRLRRPARPV